MSFNISHISNDKLNVQLNYKNLKESFSQRYRVEPDTKEQIVITTKSVIIEDITVRSSKTTGGEFRPVGFVVEKLDKDGGSIPLRTMALDLSGDRTHYFTDEFLMSRLRFYDQNGFIENEYFTGLETSENDMYETGMTMMKLKNPIVCPFGFKFSLVNRDVRERNIGYSISWSEVE